MRNPQFYATALKFAAEAARVADPAYADELDALAFEWQELATRAGSLKGRTFTMLSREINEYPWVVAKSPAVSSLLENMMRNDVT